MGRAQGGASNADGARRGASLNQQRVEVVLDQIELAQEQLTAGMKAFGGGFNVDSFVAAAVSEDPNERNNVSIIEREFEKLVNGLHELAARALDEGQKLGRVENAGSSGWKRLAELGVIPDELSDTFSRAREMRNTLGHHYPPQAWRLLHKAVEQFSPEVDPFLVRWREWVESQSIFTFKG